IRRVIARPGRGPWRSISLLSTFDFQLSSDAGVLLRRRPNLVYLNAMPELIPIPVVAAVIERNGLILIAQRPPQGHLALKWEFPGGKVEAGESPEAAIVREIREELGCEIVVGRALPRFVHTYEQTTIEMISFICRLAESSREPQLHEHVAIA